PCHSGFATTRSPRKPDMATETRLLRRTFTLTHGGRQATTKQAFARASMQIFGKCCGNITHLRRASPPAQHIEAQRKTRILPKPAAIIGQVGPRLFPRQGKVFARFY